MLRQIGITRNVQGHNLQKKKFWSIFVSKIGYFFLKMQFSTTTWPQGFFWIRLKFAHEGEYDSRKKKSVGATKLFDVVLKV